MRPAQPTDAALPEFGQPQSAAPLRTTTLRQGGGFIRRAVTDQTTGALLLERLTDDGLVRHEHTGLEIGATCEDRYGIMPDDPATAWASTDWVRSYASGDWRVRVETTTRVDAGREAFRIRATVRAYEGETLIHEQVWDEAVPRDCA